VQRFALDIRGGAADRPQGLRQVVEDSLEVALGHGLFGLVEGEAHLDEALAALLDRLLDLVGLLVDAAAVGRLHPVGDGAEDVLGGELLRERVIQAAFGPLVLGRVGEGHPPAEEGFGVLLEVPGRLGGHSNLQRPRPPSLDRGAGRDGDRVHHPLFVGRDMPRLAEELGEVLLVLRLELHEGAVHDHDVRVLLLAGRFDLDGRLDGLGLVLVGAAIVVVAHGDLR
jgi:hypothetical protein